MIKNDYPPTVGPSSDGSQRIGFFVYQEFFSESITNFFIFEKVSGIQLSGIKDFQIVSGIEL